MRLLVIVLALFLVAAIGLSAMWLLASTRGLRKQCGVRFYYLIRGRADLYSAAARRDIFDNLRFCLSVICVGYHIEFRAAVDIFQLEMSGAYV